MTKKPNKSATPNTGRPRADSYLFDDDSRRRWRRTVKVKIKTYLRTCREIGTGERSTVQGLAAEMQTHTGLHVPHYTLGKCKKLTPPINDD
jgi:hypothetical protein